jgi:peptide/nickel transport system ATP-binding protein
MRRVQALVISPWLLAEFTVIIQSSRSASWATGCACGRPLAPSQSRPNRRPCRPHQRLDARETDDANGTEPLLSVRNLRTSFSRGRDDQGRRRRVVRRVPGQGARHRRRKRLRQGVTAQSILRLVDRPGRIVDGEIILTRADGSQTDLVKLEANGSEMRSIRGGEIGLVFQEPMTSFSPVHSIGAQLIEAVRLHNAVSPKEARRRGIEALRSVGIPKPERRIDEYSFELSGGLRQRAMIAVALSCDPRLLIADEPTTALDVTTQAQILDLLRALQRERGMAIMLITHNLGVVAEMADDVVVMYLGRVVEQGKVDDIFHDPMHPYTKALLQSIPSIESAPKSKLATISGSIPHPFNRPAGCARSIRGALPSCPAVAIPWHRCSGLSARARQVSCFLHER